MKPLAASLALLLTALPAAANDLVGSRWLAEEIGGRGVVDRAQSTLQVLPDGRVAGSAGCNRYVGAGALANGKMTLRPLASTRMACPPAAMDQETRSLAALASAVRYELKRGGLLVLTDPNGSAALRFSRM